MKKSFLFVTGLLLILAMVLSACQAAPATQAPVAEPEQPVATEAPVVATEAPVVTEAPAAKATTNIVHYYSGDLGLKDMQEIITQFNAQSAACEIKDNTTGHEDFKTQILVMLAGDNPPDVFSYWAGARVQFVVDSDALMELSDYWEAEGFGDSIVAGIQGAKDYNGGVYAIPQNYHLTGMFYNPKTFAAAGITETPTNWDEFIAAGEKLIAAGVTPIALGSKDRWPAQYYFDYFLGYTAGNEYREKFQAGEGSWTDPEVVTAVGYWKDLIDRGFFVPDANAYTYTDAADMVANGQAGMTLMGTWVTGYWDGNGLVAGEDYDLFPFPTINPEIPAATYATVDAWTIPVDAANPDCAKEFVAWALTPEMQALWAKGQGALAASADVDTSIYNVVMKKANDLIAGGTKWAAGYDLSTTPPNAEVGLNLFAQLMNDASQYMTYLEDAQVQSAEVFGK